MAVEMALVRGAFEGLRKIVVPEGEEPAANVLRVSDVVFASESRCSTRRATDPARAKMLVAGILPEAEHSLGLRFADAVLAQKLRWPVP
ncbi:hypothetical protein [Mesorhizobium sp.]|uniref:hypothetical protein n=1 Tax=Mesorhizobium sp. TaxID=1871066 RepID=UPI0025798395|nr:hypothetical protein [Mesorhizobium sp.]